MHLSNGWLFFTALICAQLPRQKGNTHLLFSFAQLLDQTSPLEHLMRLLDGIAREIISRTVPGEYDTALFPMQTGPQAVDPTELADAHLALVDTDS